MTIDLFSAPISIDHDGEVDVIYGLIEDVDDCEVIYF